MNAKQKEYNRRDFYATCSDSEVVKTETYMYKFVSMFGDKTLIYWYKSGRISTRQGHNAPK